MRSKGLKRFPKDVQRAGPSHYSLRYLTEHEVFEFRCQVSLARLRLLPKPIPFVCPELEVNFPA